MILEQDVYTGWYKWQPSLDEWSMFEVDHMPPVKMKENQYLLVYDDEKKGDGPRLISQYCWENGKLRKVSRGSIVAAKGKGREESTVIYPRNDEQICAFDLMQDHDKTIKLLTGTWGTGKAQPIDTVIPTPAGNKKLGDIKPGDYVFDKIGQPTKVLSVHPQGKLDVYRITLADGRTTLCGPEHLWTVKSHSGDNKTLKTVTAEEMYNIGIGNYYISRRENKEYLDYKWHIPMNAAVMYNKDIPINAYVVGCFLGDGCCTEQGLTISSEDNFIPNEIAKIIGSPETFRKSNKNYSWGFRLPIEQQTQKYKNIQTKDIFNKLPTLLTTSNLKRIPKEYFEASIENRFDLLQGLLDTDGSVSLNKAKISFGSRNKALCEDVVYLCRGLGLRCHLNTSYRVLRDAYEYTVTITATPNEKLKLFRLPKKLNRIKEAINIKEQNNTLTKTWNNFITITNIEKLNYQEEMICIYVDNNEHLYLTNDFIVTHNTLIMVEAALEALRQGVFDRIIWIRNNIDVKDTKDLGALPGEVIDKLLPYLGPFIDHCGEAEVKTMLTKGSLYVEPLQSLRGRNFERSIIMCSEAQNLTLDHLKLIIARAAEGSEVWFDGDQRQTDRKAFEKAAGLYTMIDKLGGHHLFGYVKLVKSERSETAAIADLLDD